MKYLKSLLKNPAYLVATLLVAVFLIGNWLLVKSQNPTTPATLQGQAQTVTLRPWGTVHAGRINYSLDTDHDGMPDEVELANGLDPNNPADADGDLDGDGLTNGDEVTLGTGLQTLDPDGDGVFDAEEVRDLFHALCSRNQLRYPANQSVSVNQVQLQPALFKQQEHLIRNWPNTSRSGTLYLKNNLSCTDGKFQYYGKTV